jgi:hypothetical protein
VVMVVASDDLRPPCVQPPARLRDSTCLWGRFHPSRCIFPRPRVASQQQRLLDFARLSGIIVIPRAVSLVDRRVVHRHLRSNI